MHVDEVMRELEAAGSEQTRRIYARHGVTTPMFGVSYAVLRELQKRIRTDHGLALDLWATGNHDARVRHEMNGALIAIALRDGNLRRQATATARRIGPLDVDHGQTSCTTPDAVEYIERTRAHRARRSD